MQRGRRAAGFRWAEAGRPAVKGKAAAVEAYALDGVDRRPLLRATVGTRCRWSAGRTSWRMLERHLVEAADGRGQVVA